MTSHQSPGRRSRRSRWSASWIASLVFGSACAFWADAAESEKVELRLPLAAGAIHGFPELRDAEGRKLADAEFTQTPEGDRLRVKLSYDFGNGHRMEENTVVRQRPALMQEEWTWEETKAGEIVRRFAVDFRNGKATAEKMERQGRKQWEEKLKIDPGRTFAGFTFTLALECLRERLVRGERVELRAVGFTPKPRLVTVELSFGGLDQMTMGSRRVTGERFIIHPKIPRIVKAFIAAPDTRIWLIHPAPAGFLRWEGTPAEPTDALVRVDLLPGESSEAAEPVSTRSPK
jgi:hypothetical protein